MGHAAAELMMTRLGLWLFLLFLMVGVALLAPMPVWAQAFVLLLAFIAGVILTAGLIGGILQHRKIQLPPSARRWAQGLVYLRLALSGLIGIAAVWAWRPSDPTPSALIVISGIALTFTLNLTSKLLRRWAAAS
jgi:hypothetical protein